MLTPGSRLGPCEIVSVIGAAGSACGPTEPQTGEGERLGVGPQAHKKMQTPSPCL